MGHGYKGGVETFHSIGDNLEDLKGSFSYKSGLFGTMGNSSNNRVRNIESDFPLKTARGFYTKAACGGIEETLGSGKWKTSMEDGTVFTMREVSGSSDRSPAVDINIQYSSNSSGVKQQKIHFIQRKDLR